MADAQMTNIQRVEIQTDTHDAITSPSARDMGHDI
jgi:hypothetical protein